MTFLLDSKIPDDLGKKELDNYLKEGGYRIGQTLYKFDFTILWDGLYSVHWLRIDLNRIRWGRAPRKILRKNEKFSVVFKPFYISEELEALYKSYKNSVDFESSNSVFEYLHHEGTKNMFDTRVVEVRDGDKLIAAGYFDCGEKSLAAILNFYEPNYRQKSLGKFLFLQQILYGQQQKMNWLYPGYLVNNNARFDYKLFADEAATEVYHRKTDIWLPFSWPLPDLRPEFPIIDLYDDLTIDELFKV